MAALASLAVSSQAISVLVVCSQEVCGIIFPRYYERNPSTICTRSPGPCPSIEDIFRDMTREQLATYCWVADIKGDPAQRRPLGDSPDSSALFCAEDRAKCKTAFQITSHEYNTDIYMACYFRCSTAKRSNYAELYFWES